MAIPDYQTLMLPVLKLASDGSEHRFRDAIEQLPDSHYRSYAVAYPQRMALLE